VINSHFFLTINRLYLRLKQQVVGIVFLELSEVILVEVGIVFINTVDSRKVINIKKIETLLQKCVDWVLVVQNCLLLKVPVWLCRLQSYIVNPVSS